MSSVFLGGLNGYFLGTLALAGGLDAGASVIDAHDHFQHHSRRDWQQADRRPINAADKLGIDQLCCSLLPPRPGAPPESFRECNQCADSGYNRW